MTIAVDWRATGTGDLWPTPASFPRRSNLLRCRFGHGRSACGRWICFSNGCRFEIFAHVKELPHRGAMCWNRTMDDFTEELARRFAASYISVWITRPLLRNTES